MFDVRGNCRRQMQVRDGDDGAKAGLQGAPTEQASQPVGGGEGKDGGRHRPRRPPPLDGER